MLHRQKWTLLLSFFLWLIGKNALLNMTGVAHRFPHFISFLVVYEVVKLVLDKFLVRFQWLFLGSNNMIFQVDHS